MKKLIISILCTLILGVTFFSYQVCNKTVNNIVVEDGWSDGIIMYQLFCGLWADDTASKWSPYVYQSHGMLPTIPPIFTYWSKKGDCDDLAFMLFWSAKIAGVKDVYWVSGSTNGTLHSWVEWDKYVYDLSKCTRIEKTEMIEQGYKTLFRIG